MEPRSSLAGTRMKTCVSVTDQPRWWHRDPRLVILLQERMYSLGLGMAVGPCSFTKCPGTTTHKAGRRDDPTPPTGPGHTNAERSLQHSLMEFCIQRPLKIMES